jgi:hypothetical protein
LAAADEQRGVDPQRDTGGPQRIGHEDGELRRHRRVADAQVRAGPRDDGRPRRVLVASRRDQLIPAVRLARQHLDPVLGKVDGVGRPDHRRAPPAAVLEEGELIDDDGGDLVEEIAVLLGRAEHEHRSHRRRSIASSSLASNASQHEPTQANRGRAHAFA